MKKVANILFIASILIISSMALAEIDLQAMSTEDLQALRLAVNEELAARIITAEVPEGSAIADLFPDEWLAKNIRDKLGKFSTKDTVTQEELNTIKNLTISGQTTDHIQVSTLEGVQYLKSLTKLYVGKQDAITEIPDWIGELTNLTSLTFRICPISEIPDSLCDLVLLNELVFDYSDIVSLPNDIGNLINLKRIDISHTKITELPASIYNLKLDTFNREGLDID